MFFDAHGLKNVAQLIEFFAFWSALCCFIIVPKHLLDNLLEFFTRKSRFQLAVIMFDIFEKVKREKPISQICRILQVLFTSPEEHFPALRYYNVSEITSQAECKADNQNIEHGPQNGYASSPKVGQVRELRVLLVEHLVTKRVSAMRG